MFFCFLYRFLQERQRLAMQSEKTTGRLLWLGLGLMGVQAGLLGRLTWYEYSWDIMEPVTYFVTYSAVMAGFAYFVVTRQVRLRFRSVINNS